MREPSTTARDLDGIVEEICDHLRPWKQHLGEADVRLEVGKRIVLLKDVAANVKQWPRRADVREAVRDARKALKWLRETLASKSLEPFVVTTLPSAVAERAKTISDLLEQAGVIVIDNQYFDRLDKALALTETVTTPDPRSDPVQYPCAETADILIHELSTRWPATGTADSPLHAIASLLYEVVTGQPDQNLKRAVDAMIRSWRGLDSVGGRGRPARKPAKD